MKVTQCRICKSKDLKLIFSLGEQPLANKLMENKEDKAKVYPLELLQCQLCSLIQLSYVVPKEEMYSEYLYIPSLSKTYLKHFEKLADSLIQRLNLQPNDFVVDIGGSDGSLSKTFKEKGMRVLNVEPADNLQKINKINGVEVYHGFFNEEVATAIVEKYGKAKLVTATNSFAHIDDLDEYLRALDILLDDDGIFFAQFPDVRNLMRSNQFDTIYHEHLSYFTLEPLHFLFTNTPFEMFKVRTSEIHGGSMGIYVRRKYPYLNNFTRDVKFLKRDLTDYLLEQKSLGKKIIGYGAAAKGMVLLYYCNLNNKIIDVIVDGTPFKQGKFTPGTAIPIVSEQSLTTLNPDIILILAWNFKEEIIAKVRQVLPKVTFVVPIPKVEII